MLWTKRFYGHLGVSEFSGDSREFRDFRDSRDSSSEKSPFVMTPFVLFPTGQGEEEEKDLAPRRDLLLQPRAGC